MPDRHAGRVFSHGPRGVHGTPGTGRDREGGGVRRTAGPRRTPPCRRARFSRRSGSCTRPRRRRDGAPHRARSSPRSRVRPRLGRGDRTHHLGRTVEVFREVSIRFFDEMTAERLESCRLRAVEARDSDVSSDDCDGRGRERVHLEETRAFQVSDCGCHIPPRGLRHEERADDRLERRLRRPPTLRAVVREESVERLLHAVHHGAAMANSRMRIARWSRRF